MNLILGYSNFIVSPSFSLVPTPEWCALETARKMMHLVIGMMVYFRLTRQQKIS
jgi:hypothetical protein